MSHSPKARIIKTTTEKMQQSQDLQDELDKSNTEYARMSAERKAYKKEADRLSRLAQQKRDSQKTVQRYLQNEQAAKRKKNQLE